MQVGLEEFTKLSQGSTWPTELATRSAAPTMRVHVLMQAMDGVLSLGTQFTSVTGALVRTQQQGAHIRRCRHLDFYEVTEKAKAKERARRDAVGDVPTSD